MDCPPPQWTPSRPRLSASDRRRTASDSTNGTGSSQSTSRRGTRSSDALFRHSSRADSVGSYDPCASPIHTCDSFGSPLCSPTTSFINTPSSSRRPSAVSLVSERLVDLRSRLKQNPKKLAKKGLPRPKRSDQLDKPSTQKLTKFWDSLSNLTKVGQGASSNSNSEECSACQVVLASGQYLLDPLPRPYECLLPGSPPRTDPPPLPGPPVPLVNSQPDPELAGRNQFLPCLASISEISHERRDLPIKMDYSRLMPESRLVADQEDRSRRVKDAQAMSETIRRNAERSRTGVPPYQFLELIGKGSYGRVYKCREQTTGNLVAVKIADVEFEDWSHKLKLEDDREGTIRDFRKEVSILQTLKDNNAKNVNVIHDAFDLHSQLWIVADYCTGGSVRTLQRPFHKDGKAAGLPEQFIIPIARELAVAMESIHEMGIVHRDIKCANVYITEDGTLQLGDFGVTGIMEDDRHAKRKTIVGTPHWMPPELLEAFDTGIKEEGYGTEVDIYSYGALLVEMVTGNPPLYQYPKEDLAEVLQANSYRIENEEYSPELRDLANSCLSTDATARPSANDILMHPAIVDTSTSHPTASLVRLIERFKMWEHGGGSRVSLWIAGPTDRPTTSEDEAKPPAADIDESDDWNFSTSEDFDRRFSQLPAIGVTDLQSLQALPGLPLLDTKITSVAERIKKEHSELSATRGEKLLAPLYDITSPSGYQITSPEPMEEPPAPSTDLPLRNFTAGAPMRESMIEIDLDEASASEPATATFGLSMDPILEDTIRPSGRKQFQDDEDDDDYTYGDHNGSTDKRATMEWKFPGAQPVQPKRDTMAWTFPATQAPQPKRGTMDWTFGTAETAAPEISDNSEGMPSAPLAETSWLTDELPALEPTRESMASVIDLDLGSTVHSAHLEDPSEIVRPSTANSTAESFMTSGNPFDLEDDPAQNEVDRQRFSYHKQWQSEGGPLNRRSHTRMAMHARGSSLSSTEPDLDADINASVRNSRQQRPTNGYHIGRENVDTSADDMSQWPSYTDQFATFDSGPLYEPPHGEVNGLSESVFPNNRDIRAGSSASRLRGMSTAQLGLEISFPEIRLPNMDALAEDADPRLLENELYHTLNDVASSLKAVETAFRQYANIDDDDFDYPLSSDADSSFESTKEETEDESRVEQLTTRRNRPRRLEKRSPSGAATAQSLQ